MMKIVAALSTMAALTSAVTKGFSSMLKDPRRQEMMKQAYIW